MADFTPPEQCWASLQESSLNTLVQMLKTAIICQIHCWVETSQTHCSVKALLEVMKKVYKVSVHLKGCTYHLLNPNPLGLSQLESYFVLFSTTERKYCIQPLIIQNFACFANWIDLEEYSICNILDAQILKHENDSAFSLNNII